MFDKKIDRLGTHSKQWDYVEDRFGRKDLLPFTIADMDFLTAPPVLTHLQERINHGIYGYTKWEQTSYLRAIQGWYEQRFTTVIEQESIVYSPSVIYSISKLIGLVSEENDHVVLQTPAYDGLFDVIQSNHRVLVANELSSQNGHYFIDFKSLEEKLSHPKAKIFLLCSPHNPTGRVWSQPELERMLNLCEKHGVFVISDEVHMDVLRKNQKHLPVLKVAKNLERVCICTSPNKTFNTPGLIGSYVLIPNEDLRKRFLYTTRNQDGFYSISIMGMTALTAAYELGGPWVDELNAYVEENLSVVGKFLKQELPEVVFTMPESTYLSWLDLRGLKFSNSQMQKALVEVGKIALVPGEAYGPDGAGYLRFNIACPREKVLDGIHRLKKAINSLNDIQ